MPNRIDLLFPDDDDFIQPKKQQPKAVKPALKNTLSSNELAAKQLELQEHKKSL